MLAQKDNLPAAPLVKDVFQYSIKSPGSKSVSLRKSHKIGFFLSSHLTLHPYELELWTGSIFYTSIKTCLEKETISSCFTPSSLALQHKVFKVQFTSPDLELKMMLENHLSWKLLQNCKLLCFLCPPATGEVLTML